MKRILTALIFGMFMISIAPGISQELENLHLDVRDYNGIELPAGTFVSVESAQEISTQYCQNGYKAYFITTNDYYIGDTNVIPESTMFVGYVEDVHDPIVGTNASFKVKITKMVLPDGYEMNVNGYIYSDNKNIIGGEMTAPAEWKKMPHYQSMLRFSQISLQVRPARQRQKGSHAVITSGEDKIIVLTEPVTITHTLTN
jgi:hypothetical protein